MTYQFSTRVPASDEDPVGNILKVAGSPDIISFAGGSPRRNYFRLTLSRRSQMKFMMKVADRLYNIVLRLATPHYGLKS